MGLELQAVIAPAFLHRQEPFTEGMKEIAEAFLYMQRHFPAPSPEDMPDNSDQQTLDEAE